MRTKIQYIILLAVTVLLAGCNNEQDPFNVSSNKGSFALNLNNGEIVVNTETRGEPRTLSASEAADYNIMVYQNSIEFWKQKQKYKNLSEYNMLSVGSGYAVSAESCTEADAEEGFGCPRYAGRSESFQIEANKNTSVTVTCTPTNGGLCVVFDESFTKVFGSYSVTTTDDRKLRFDATNGATFTKVDGKDKRNKEAAVAYYNLNSLSEEEKTVELEILAKGAKTITKEVLIKKGKITRFTVKGEDYGQGTNTGTIDIVIGYDDDYGTDDNSINVD